MNGAEGEEKENAGRHYDPAKGISTTYGKGREPS